MQIGVASVFAGLLCPFAHSWLLLKPIILERPCKCPEPWLRSAKQDGQNSDQEGAPGVVRKESILDDGKGHISGDLATSIWEWDHEHRLHDKNEQEKFPFSTRAGLRWVDEIATHMLDTLDTTASSSTSSSSSTLVQDSSASSYSDLVQEGVVALLHAMTHYQDHVDTTTERSFEQYTRQYIADKMRLSLARDSRPIQIPRKVQSLLRHARKVRQQHMEANNGHEPTLAEVAEALNVSSNRLELYQLVSGGQLSVEQTIEIYDPLMEGKTTFADQDRWESENHAEQSLLEDDDAPEEGDDEMWVHHEQIAAPLKDAIPDYTSDPETEVSQSLMEKDVDDFLVGVLTEPEQMVIRMRFGLDRKSTSAAAGVSYASIASQLGMSKTQVRQIEVQALEKLKESTRSQSLELYLDDENDETVDGTVSEE